MIFASGKAKNQMINPLAERAPENDPGSKLYKPAFKSREPKKRDRSWEKTSKATTLKDVLVDGALRSNRSILTSRAATDVEAPARSTMGLKDISVIEKIRRGDIAITRGAEIKAANKAVEEARQAARKEAFRIDPDAVKAAMRPVASIASNAMHAKDGHGRTVAAHQFGIYDSADKLDNMVDPTKGTQIRKAAEARRNAPRDRSWETVSKPQTSRSKLDELFANLKAAKAAKQ